MTDSAHTIGQHRSGTPSRRSGWGVTARLLGLVMLPVTVMCVLTGSVVLAHRSSATRANSVEAGVSGLNDLVALRAKLNDEQAAARFDVRFAELGTTREEAVAFIGFDWGSQRPAARAESIRLATTLGAASPVDAGTLQTLYAAMDVGTTGPVEAAQQLDGFGQATRAAVNRGLDQLESDARQLPLLAALESLRIAANLLDVTTPQVIDLSGIWFPTPGATPESITALVARFGAESADYTNGKARLRDLGVASVIAGLDRIDADAAVALFQEAVAAGLAGEPLTAPGAPLDTVKVSAAFQGHLVLDGLLDTVVLTAATAAREQARQLAASERASYLTWSLGAAGLALVSIAVALWLARTISRPLKDLAGYAHAVNEGHLDVDPARGREHGPRETRMAFGVVTDLVANLQLLDAKANALAQCNFDDPILSRPLPGRLGRSLESSVALLSGSIVERDELQTHLAHLATHDSLTGIFNRAAALAAIQTSMQRATRTGATTAVLFIDLNEFKAVNDSHGHEIGDEVLRQTAHRMELGLRTGDVVARLGGDEFVVVAEAVTDVAEATTLARRIIETVSETVEIGTLRIHIGAAIGVALSLDGPEEPLRLLARADAAMYRAKLHEQSSIEIFDAGLQREMLEREDIEAGLTAALEDLTGGGLHLQYQPVLEAASGVLVSAEALIRWDRPGQGTVQPDSFIPIAEATAMIIDLDCWVLGEATRQLAAWSEVADLATMPVAVNISGRHLLSRQLPSHIQTALDRTGIDPRRLTIEITETVLLTDLVLASHELDAVRALGVKVAVDDFGTGYTSLAHLQQLPIDIIKIDRSFISQLNVKRGSSLVRLVTDLGHAIEITIVAEGVETADELHALQEMGADHLQGYLLSKPLDPSAIAAWAHKHGGVPHPV